MLTDGHGPPIEAVNCSPISTYGTRFMELCFGEQWFGWDLVTAKVAFPLLCTDFLCAYGLLVLLSTTDDYLQLLAEFPVLTQPTFSSSTAKHGLLHIATTGPTVYAQAQCLDPAKLTIARAEFANMEPLCILRRSDSPWASPVHIVPKPGGG